MPPRRRMGRTAGRESLPCPIPMKMNAKKVRMKMNNDKTIYHKINQMAFPVLLNYLLSTVFELLDKAIVGHYSVQGFAVVGIAASFVYAITGALGILSAAFNIVAAEEKGKKNRQGFEITFVTSKYLALLIGMGFFVLSLLGGRFFFQYVYGVRSDNLAELLSYYYPAAFTVPQNLLIFQYSAYFRNCLNTRITLFSTVISTGVNLFFDFSLVYGYCGLPRLGTAGAAWGSVAGLAAGLLVYRAAYHPNRGMTRHQIKNRIKAISAKILRLYPSLFGQELLESTIFTCVISAVVARLGTQQAAVYSLLDTVVSTMGLPVYAYAAATQTLALQNHSAGEMTTVRHYLKSGLLLAFGIVSLLCALCGMFNKPLLHLIVDDDPVIQQAQRLLWLAFLMPPAKIPYQVYMNYLQGVGREKLVLSCTAAGTFVTGISAIIAGKLAGLAGLYLVMTAEFILLGTCYGFMARKG